MNHQSFAVPPARPRTHLFVDRVVARQQAKAKPGKSDHVELGRPCGEESGQDRQDKTTDLVSSNRSDFILYQLSMVNNGHHGESWLHPRPPCWQLVILK